MPVFAVSCDLHQPGQNYDALYEAIKGCGTWWHYLDSTWLLSTDLTAPEIRDRITAATDSTDTLLVVKLSGAWATSGMKKQGTDWLQKHL